MSLGCSFFIFQVVPIPLLKFTTRGEKENENFFVFMRDCTGKRYNGKVCSTPIWSIYHTLWFVFNWHNLHIERFSPK